MARKIGIGILVALAVAVFAFMGMCIDLMLEDKDPQDTNAWAGVILILAAIGLLIVAVIVRAIDPKPPGSKGQA